MIRLQGGWFYKANDIVSQQRAADLAEMITRVIREGLEGLVLKDIKV